MEYRGDDKSVQIRKNHNVIFVMHMGRIDRIDNPITGNMMSQGNTMGQGGMMANMMGQC